MLQCPAWCAPAQRAVRGTHAGPKTEGADHLKQRSQARREAPYRCVYKAAALQPRTVQVVEHGEEALRHEQLQAPQREVAELVHAQVVVWLVQLVLCTSDGAAQHPNLPPLGLKRTLATPSAARHRSACAGPHSANWCLALEARKGRLHGPQRPSAAAPSGGPACARAAPHCRESETDRPRPGQTPAAPWRPARSPGAG